MHSPFVYDLVTRCFYDTTAYPQYKDLDLYRKQLHDSKEILFVTDHGSGSRIFRSDERPVAAIAKHAGIVRKRQRLLFRLVQYLQPHTVLELGTSLGLGTIALGLGNPTAEVHTVEGCPVTAKYTSEALKKARLHNARVHTAVFEDFFSKTPHTTFDLVYIDGSHSQEQTLQNFQQLLNRKKEGTLLIFDDIYLNPSMTEAWRAIVHRPEVSVSIDTFQWGLVFFRSGQKKEHFTIRL
ncbi:class I SAM-dependent methyltransferase [Altibacter sp.]|uniref:O-methyltransferase n=1 Tax=Altibacter sp. TaxID=2024823 RepID=UPI0025C63435|nr:class I SAM-dependent methyltransferase [Altibacter sp.]